MLYDYPTLRGSFLKEASDRGYDSRFLDGFLKEAEDIYAGWSDLLNSRPEFQSQEFCKQAFVEVWQRVHPSSPQEKQAEGEFGPELLSMLSGLGDQVGGLFGQQGGAGLGGALAGGGGGMILGMLLSQLFDIPMPMGLLLGALGGGALGYGAAGTTGGQKNVFGVGSPVQGPPPAHTAGAGAGKMRQMEGTGQVAANPAAAQATASNAAHATQVADPSRPATPPPQPQPQAAPVQPPPQQPMGQPPGMPGMPGGAPPAVQPPAAMQPPRTPQPKQP